MTQIPSDIPASAAQAGFQANQIAKERDARRAGGADAAGRHIKTVDEAGATVETDDADAAVFADAEGAGSQGRRHEENEPDNPLPDEADEKTGGITRDDQGRFHVDLEV
ncbi:MAG: hypothetical protein ACE5EX_09650 [Phycisphaerae bacterium]